MAERDDASRSFSDLVTAVVARSPAEVIVRATSEPWVAIDCENAWPRVSIAFRESAVTRSSSVVSWVVLALSASTSDPRRVSTICARRSVCC